jgi:SnoaL-like domain
VSTDRIAAVRRIFEVVNEATRCQRFPREEADEILDPGFRLDASRYVFNPGVYQGVDGLREFVDGILEMWEAVEIHPEELLEAGERIVALIVLRGRGREGVEASRRGANVFTLRGDKVVEWIVGMDEPEAMKEVVGDRASEQAGRKHETRPR